MKFSRRTPAQRGLAATGLRARSRWTRDTFEMLESRVLMTGEKTIIAWGGQQLEVAKNEYTVHALVATRDAASLAALLNKKGLHVDYAKSLGGGGMYAFVDTKDAVAGIEQWNKSHPNFVVGPNSIYYTAVSAVTVNDSGTSGNLAAFLGSPDSNPGAADASDAWGVATGNHNTIVAILDSGINETTTDANGALIFDQIRYQLWTNPKEVPGNNTDDDGDGVVDDVNGANFTNILNSTIGGSGGTNVIADNTTYPVNVLNGSGQAMLLAHGTDVAGIIGAPGNDGTPTAGINWNIQMIPVVVFNGVDTDIGDTTATDASIIAGLNYVMTLKQQGVNVSAINMSFGRHYFGPASGIQDIGNGNGNSSGNADTSAINVFTAMGRATSMGMVIVTAAGNGGTNDDNFFYVPAHFSNSRAITVAAEDLSGNIGGNSNYGPQTVQIAAPGVGIDVLSTRLSGTGGGGGGFGGGTAASGTTLSGSSLAAAFVTGAVALLKSAKPSATPDQLVAAILKGANHLQTLNGAVAQGRSLDIFHSLELLIGNTPDQGKLETFNSQSFSGWLFDPNQGNSPSTGFIKIDGVDVLDFTASTNRTDLIRKVGSPDHGFTFNTFTNTALQAALTPGKHKVELWINDTVVGPTGSLTLDGTGNPVLIPTRVASVVVQGNVLPVGGVKSATFDAISGWAYDPNVPQSIGAQVEIDVDGSQFMTFNASSNGTTASQGNHAGSFSFTINRPRNLVGQNQTNPDAVWIPSGTHRLDFYAIDDYTGQKVFIGTKTVTGDTFVPQGSANYTTLGNTSASFQQGANGYSGQVDTYVIGPNGTDSTFETQDNSASSTLFVEAQNATQSVEQTLIRFDNMFGGGAGQIPLGSTILSALLTVTTVTPGNGANVNEMLIPWGATDTYSTLVNGVSVNNQEARSTATFTIGGAQSLLGTGAATLDVTADVAAWASGQINDGWVLTPLANGNSQWGIASSEAADSATRPVLNILYAPPNAPHAIVGNVIDEDNPLDPMSLQVIVDGTNGRRQIYSAVTDPLNPQTIVVNARKTLDNVNFVVTLPDLPPGVQRIILRAYDPDTGVPTNFVVPIAFRNTVPTGQLDAFATTNQAPTELTGFVRDPDTSDILKEPIYYRLDVDGMPGQIELANVTRADQTFDYTDIGFDVPVLNFFQAKTNLDPNSTISQAQHTITLQAIDSTTFQLRQIQQRTFTQQDNQGNSLPTGTVSQFTNTLISGVAYDPSDTTVITSNSTGNNNSTTVIASGLSVYLYADTNGEPAPGDPFTFAATANLNTATNGIVLGQSSDGFQFTSAQLNSLGQGNHYIRIYAVDSSDPTTMVLLYQNELTIGTRTGGAAGTGRISNANFVDTTAAAAAPLTDSTPLYVLNYSNGTTVLGVATASPAAPTVGISGDTRQFVVDTPAVTQQTGNRVVLSYFDSITGVLRNLNTQNIPFPASSVQPNTFINGVLVVGGNQLPTGNLIAASQQGFKGWVGDPDDPNAPIEYRIDIDGVIGQTQVANVLTSDTSVFGSDTITLTGTVFPDPSAHGFLITPGHMPNLTPGQHKAVLWAIDQETHQAVAINSRIFNVSNSTNRKPTGSVTTFTGTSVQGFAQDTSKTSATLPINVYVDGSTTPTFSLTANQAGHGGHGFSLSEADLLTIGPGEHYLDIRAGDVDSTGTPTGTEYLIGGGPLEIGTPQIGGIIDTLNFQQFGGWVAGAANDPHPLFQFVMNGVPFLTLSGDDLPETVENGRNVRRFLLTTPVAPTLQNTTFQTYYINSITGQQILLASKVLAPIQKTLGQVTTLNTTTVSGWAYSPSLPDGTVQVNLLIDNIPAMTAFADQDFANLTGAKAGHGFAITLPSAITAGRHTISVTVTDPVTGDQSLILNKVLTFT